MKAVLFDLGGTLVQYYDRSQIPQVLEEAITAVQDEACSGSPRKKYGRG
jgi:FMN phosphatase YigB (HAD superfamily)